MAYTIVWIDDDTDILDPVVGLLERAQHRIERIRSVGEALEKIDLIRRSDLILLDILLPPGKAKGDDYGRYSGLGLLRELREKHGIDNPVVVLSVITNKDAQHDLRALQVKYVIRKPVLPSDLKARVEEVLAEAAAES
jgi:CheY-like chemotaxis protein